MSKRAAGHRASKDSRNSRDTRDSTFEEIVRRTSNRLRHVAFLLCGSWIEADDLVQMTYLKAYRYADRVVAVEAPDAYLKQILVRTCIDESRKRRISEYPTDSFPEVRIDEEMDDDKWTVRAALAKVPRSQREILILRYYADMSVDETAAVLHCSSGNVKSQTSRGLAALERAIAAEDTGDPRAS